MLVLTRRVGEEIVIGDEIRLMVVQVKESRARLGIQAPPTTVVVRIEQLLESANAYSPREAVGQGATAREP